MDSDRVLQVVKILMYLLKVSQWEVRHGALLGIKYLLAVREVLYNVIFKSSIYIHTYISSNISNKLSHIGYLTGFTR